MNGPNPDFDELGARLRRERPDLSADAYERVHDRVAAQAPRARRTSRASIATALCIALGVLLTGGGASLAVSGLASDTTAVRAQYAPTATTPTPGVGIQGEVVTTTTPTTPITTTDGQAAAQGDTDEDDPTLGGQAGEQDQVPQAPVQIQAASGGDELPFTGFAAIPIVIIGAALIATGAILRRRTHP